MCSERLWAVSNAFSYSPLKAPRSSDHQQRLLLCVVLYSVLRQSKEQMGHSNSH